MFHQMVLLTEEMNTLKCQLNAEKQCWCKNHAHLDPISLDEEELHIPVNSVPVILPLPSPPATGPSNEPITTQAPLVPFAAKVIPIDEAHIATPAAPPTTPVLTTSEWSLLIAKAQSGDFPCTMQGQVHDPNAGSPSAPWPLTTQRFSQQEL